MSLESPALPASVPPGPVAAPLAPVPTGRLWALALVAALAAGAVAAGLNQATVHFFEPPVRMVTAMGALINVPTYESRVVADTKNATLANAALGAALGLALGLAGGLARRSVRSGLVAAGLGAVAGAGVGALAATAFVTLYFRQMNDPSGDAVSSELVMSFLVHATMWATAGLVGGVALGVGLGSRAVAVKAGIGGAIGGLLATVLYEVAAAMAFPNGGTSQPLIQSTAPRVMACLLVAVLASALAAHSAADTLKARPVPPPAA